MAIAGLRCCGGARERRERRAAGRRCTAMVAPCAALHAARLAVYQCVAPRRRRTGLARSCAYYCAPHAALPARWRGVARVGRGPTAAPNLSSEMEIVHVYDRDRATAAARASRDARPRGAPPRRRKSARPEKRIKIQPCQNNSVKTQRTYHLSRRCPSPQSPHPDEPHGHATVATAVLRARAAVSSGAAAAGQGRSRACGGHVKAGGPGSAPPDSPGVGVPEPPMWRAPPSWEAP